MHLGRKLSLSAPSVYGRYYFNLTRFKSTFIILSTDDFNVNYFAAPIVATSTFTPGPMVELMDTFLI